MIDDFFQDFIIHDSFFFVKRDFLFNRPENGIFNLLFWNLWYQDMAHVDIGCGHDGPDVDFFVGSAELVQFRSQKIDEIRGPLSYPLVKGNGLIVDQAPFVIRDSFRFDQAQGFMTNIDADINQIFEGLLIRES
ncbi:MAG: hypothetical protein NTW71_03155 [Deltaproteobacteria bacterium]|nr:hypothetical protein [Deltaproteobacteria bacterium]